MEKYTGFEIAVIGMAGRFPGAGNIRLFWEHLKEGRDCIGTFTDQEAIEGGESGQFLKNPSYVKAHGWLDGKQFFDAGFFGYTPGEAELMDPQMRIFHECSWEALEDSGYGVRSFSDKVGVFAAGTNNFNWALYSTLKNREGLADEFSASLLRDITFLATRISYKFNCKGPALFVQSACSSSLTAIHQACNSLIWGECGMALAGGVTITNYSKRGYFYKEGMILSKDGKCLPFDSRASGTVSGEGAGVVVLKRWKDAVRDGDHIYAIVKGSGINNDGNDKAGYTAPGVKGQADAIARALKMARVSADTISYVETHGTATLLGDPIEIEALHKAYGRGPARVGTCAIGSVKSVIGHLDSAAGIAGFIKTVLALANRQIPPSPYFEEVNPRIDFRNSPFYVNTRPIDWENHPGALRAGVSSFGIGGTNVHVILEEAPVAHTSAESRDHQLIVLSGSTKEALERNTVRLADHLRDGDSDSLPDVAYTLQKGRDRLRYRRMFVCRNRMEAVTMLTSGGFEDGQASGLHEDLQNIVFMFPGQGSQYAGMCKGLYAREKTFKDTVDECLAIVSVYTDRNLWEVLYPGDADQPAGEPPINDTRNAQPLLFILEYSLARLLMSWGIQPHYLIGHSIGEWVAACLSGVFSLRDALRLVIRRGELMGEAERGSMLSVSISRDQLDGLSPCRGVSIAAINSPTSLVLSGPSSDIKVAEAELIAKGFPCKTLHTSHAFHSPMMENVRERFEAELASVMIHAPAIPFISNLTGTIATYEELRHPSYWSRHLLHTVNFAAGIDHLLAKGEALFIEAGPGRSLSNYVAENGTVGARRRVVNTVRQVRQEVDDQVYLAGKLGQLWLHGVSVSWDAYYAGEQRRRTPLPTYSFEKTAFTTDVDAEKYAAGLTGASRYIDSDDKNCLHIPVWQRSILPGAVPASVQQGSAVLLFEGRESFSGRLAEKMIGTGLNVISVRQGNAYRQLSGKSFEADIAEPAHLRQLWHRIGESGIRVTHIVYCPTLTGEDVSADHAAMMGKLNDGYLGLSYIARTIASGRNPEKILLAVVSNHLAAVTGDDEIDPLKAAIHGPARIIASENLQVECKVIDIPYPFREPDTADNISDKVLNELFYDYEDVFVAYRFKERWVQTYTALPHQRGIGTGEKIVPNGNYIVTGGLGGMGLAIAADLVFEHRANVILVHRSHFPGKDEWDHWLEERGTDDVVARKIGQLRRMEDSGCTVRLYQADVGIEEHVLQFSRWINEKVPRINGLIWAAGEVDRGGILLGRDKSSLLSYLASKVDGLLLFSKYLDFSRLDFLSLFSSIGSIFYQSKFGQAAYNAANSFLEAFAQYESKRSGLHVFAINWCDWLDVGMTVNILLKETEGNVPLANARIRDGVYPDEGVRIFHRCLQSGMSVLAVHKANLQMAILSMKEEFDKTRQSLLLSSSGSDPDGTDGKIDPEERLTEVFARFFGKDHLEPGDDFFELGGDSLRGMSLIARINSAFGTRLVIGDLYRYPTIREMAQQLPGHIALQPETRISPAPSKASYVLSSAQKRMYFLQQLDRESTAYNETKAYWVYGRLALDKLQLAVGRLVERYEVLRTAFIVEGEIPRQLVLTTADFHLTYLGAGSTDPETAVRSFIHPFDLSRGRLFRIGVLKYDSEKHLVITDSHHIVTDGISNSILFGDLIRLYTGEELPTLQLHFKDYAEWQQSNESRGQEEMHREFWLKEFAEEPETLRLPFDHPRAGDKRQKGTRCGFTIASGETRQLKALAEKQDVSLFMVLLSAFYVLLYKLSGQEDLVIICPAAGRRHADTEDMVGMFVNTMPIRNRVDPGMTFRGLLTEVREKVLTCFDNQDYQYEDLISELRIGRDASRNPLSDVMFAFDNFEEREFVVPGLTAEPYAIVPGDTKFDLCLTAREYRGSLEFGFEYSNALFEEATIGRFIRYYQVIIARIMEDQRIRITDIDILPEVERQIILTRYNDPTLRTAPIDESVISLFESRVSSAPDSIAVQDDESEYTYREIDLAAGRMAVHLRGIGIQKGEIVAVVMGRSVRLVTAVLAVLKAGAAYLPMDPWNPRDRIESIVADSGARVLLTDGGEFAAGRLQEGCEVIRYDRSFDSKLARTEGHIAGTGNGQDLFYVIYTSGTTGRPKGAMIRNDSFVNLVRWYTALLDVSPENNFMLISPLGFDLTQKDIFTPLLNGARLTLSARDQNDFSGIAEIMETKKVDIVNCAPAAFNFFLDRTINNEHRRLKGLRKLILGGEAINPAVFRSWRLSPFFNCDIVNSYGPTECTDVVASYLLGPADLDGGSAIPIGKPIPNAHIYILRDGLQLQPVGVPGEVCIGGICVSNGYLRNDALTKEKFVANPFGEGLLYRTGDIGYWREDGNIVFMQRRDTQVKIRGFRIELGEIESLLAGHPQIREAVVLPKEREGQPFLVAYYHSPEPIRVAELRNYLMKKFPEYMIPAYFIHLLSMPLSPNGKLDKKALPDVEIKAGEDYTAPENDIEEALAGIWSEVLNIGVEKIGTGQSFFELGGDSFTILRLNSRMNEKLQLSISVPTLFRYTTIAAMAEYIQSGDNDAAVYGKIAQEEVEGMMGSIGVFGNNS